MLILEPRSFPLDANPRRFLFFDCFIRDLKLIIVSTYYKDVTLDFSGVELLFNNRRLPVGSEVGQKGFEPSRVIVYELLPQELRVENVLRVRFLGQERSFVVERQVQAGSKRFTAATLFKDDLRDIAAYYRYYKNQGVDRFILFYNGNIAKVQSLLFQSEDIVYGSWDFPFLVDDSRWNRGGCRLGGRAVAIASRLAGRKREFLHHAQTAFIAMLRSRFFPDCSYLLLNDLDEYIHIPGTTIKQYLDEQPYSAVSVRSYWSISAHASCHKRILSSGNRLARTFRSWRARMLWVLCQLSPDSTRRAGIGFQSLNTIIANRRSEGYLRMKSIYRHDYSGFFGIHVPKNQKNTGVSEDMKLYHLINSHHEYRECLIEDDVTCISLVE